MDPENLTWQCHECNAYYLDDTGYARHAGYHQALRSNASWEDKDSARRNIQRADMRAMGEDLLDLFADLAPRNSSG